MFEKISNVFRNKEKKENKKDKPLYDYFFKIVLLSDKYHGNTCLAGRFTTREFPQTTGTIGVEFYDKTIRYQGKSVKLIIWDLSHYHLSSSRGFLLLKSMLKDASCLLTTRSINEYHSSDLIPRFEQACSLFLPEDTPRILVFTKNDLEHERVTSRSEYATIANEFGTKTFMECSAKTGEGVNAVFFKAVELIFKHRQSPNFESSQRLLLSKEIDLDKVRRIFLEKDKTVSTVLPQNLISTDSQTKVTNQISPILNQETEEDIQMKELVESQMRRIEELEKNQAKINEFLTFQNNQLKEQSDEIAVLKDTLKKQNEVNHSLQFQVSKLSKPLNDLELRTDDYYNDDFQTLFEFNLDDLRRMMIAVPKFIDGMISLSLFHREKQMLNNLKALLTYPEDFNLKGLSLLPYMDILENRELLKEQGAIISWNQLQKAVEEMSIVSSIDRPYVKRLIEGLKLLEKAWHKGKILNKALEDQLNEKALLALKDAFPDIIQSIQTIPFPDIQQRFKALREKEIQAWLSGNEELSLERSNHWDALVKDRILAQWYSNTKELNPLSVPLEECLRLLLIDQYKQGCFPEEFNSLLNQNTLCELIYEKVKGKKGNNAFQNLVLAECKLLKEKYPHDREAMEKEVARQIYLQWLSGELKDKSVLKQIDKMGCSLLENIKFNQMGDLYSNLKKEAVDLLMLQFKKNELSPLSQDAVMDMIQSILINDKFTEEQKHAILEDVHEAFKAGQIKDESLIALCSDCIKKPLMILNDCLKPQEPQKKVIQSNNQVTFFQNDTPITINKGETTKETYVSNTFQ